MNEQKSTADQSSLGHAVAYDADYDPGLLFPIPRSEGRERLGIALPLPFCGQDVWNGWELSWLDARGKPQVAWAEFHVPADTPNIIESKSFKLYLNSLNQHRFATVEQLVQMLRRDLSACAGGEVVVAVHRPDSWSSVPVVEPAGECLDDLAIDIEHYTPRPELLQVCSPRVERRQVFSRLLRSRCPVTGQPDWGCMLIDYTGALIDPAGLLAYIVSFRQHQDFHEQCVERMFCDILARCAPQALTVQARYLRRGGLDINPCRSTGVIPPSNPRLFLQ
jgi:7-cyano-7-deazaguanine reductase